MQLPMAPKRRRVTWVGLGWVALILVLVLGGVGAVLARDQVVAQWPPAARLYAMVGMPVTVPGDGLKLTKITPSRGTENGQPALIIEGEVTNVSNVALDVPKLRATLRDSNERELQSWTFSATESRLLPGASVPFRSSVTNPSDAATGVVVTFAGGS
jgi:hypothetical protein